MLGRAGTRLQVGTSADLDAIDFAREMRREQLLNEQFAAATSSNHQSQHAVKAQQQHLTPHQHHHTTSGTSFPIVNGRGYSTASSNLSAMPSLSPI